MDARRLKVATVLAAHAVLTIPCTHSEESFAMNNDRLSASRVAPAKIAPVTIDGVRYAQVAGKQSVDGQIGGLLAAYNLQSEVLWTLKIYDNRRRPELEGDVQDVFFRSMSANPDGLLRIVNERGETFLVDVKTRSVTASAKVKPADDDEDALVAPK
jgi:hypothetical protein